MGGIENNWQVREDEKKEKNHLLWVVVQQQQISYKSLN